MSRLGQASDSMDSANEYSDSPTKENDSPFDSDQKRSSLTMTSPSTAGPAARSPLSWQRRPPSQASERPKSRPLSTVALENAAARSSPSLAEPTSASDQPVTRDQIAQSLAGKDPSWFRQTADRGQNSAAYRKNQVEDSDTLDMTSLRTQLPGMSKNAAPEPSKEMSSPPPRESAATASQVKLGTPLSLTSAQRLEPPTAATPADTNDTPSLVRQSSSVLGGRTSPTRSPSPTKGMGGFVQSAMMKRSDSVKRWSVTSPGGLQRADSVVSNRNSLESLQRSPGKTHSRQGSTLRDGSATPTSRPTSSHEREEKPTEHARAATPEPKDDKTTPPTSPSKTMDPRRWSPTKSSWLEAALNKPESPKPKPAPPQVSQPAWMLELNKVKSQKTGPDRSASVPKKPEVKPSGLMRSTPMGSTVKPVGLGVFPGVPAAAPGDVPGPAGFRSNLTKGPSRRGSEDPDSEAQGASDDAAAKAKPEPAGKIDFRSNLKPRVPPPDNTSTGQVDELKNVFGNLRRTRTQNYVAPDELKNNILRGKAALNVTGGPKKNERVDEFKEAILKKKEEFKKAQLEGRSVARTSSSSSEKTIPEGLAKKLELHKTGSKYETAVESPLQTPSTFTESTRSSFLSTTSRREGGDTTPHTLSRAASELEEPTPRPEPRTLPQKEASAPGRLQTKAGGGLADRFNPGLAGIFARGPPGASGPSKSSGPSGSASTETEAPSGPGPQLTHMTKNRARGPRRKAPTSVVAPVGESQEPAAEPVLQSPVQLKRTIPPLAQKPSTAPKPDLVPLVDSKKSFAQERPTVGTVIPLIDSSKRRSQDVPMTPGRPITLVDSPTLTTRPRSPTIKTRPRSPTKVHEQVAALAAKSQQQHTRPEGNDESYSQPPSPRKLDMKRMSRFFDEQSQHSPQPEPAKSRPSSPTKERSVGQSQDKVDSQPTVSVKGSSALFGGATGQPKTPPKPKSLPGPPKEEERPQLPPKGARPLPAPPSPSKTPIASPARSPTKYGLEVSAILNDFFGEERPARNYTADTADILARRPQINPKIQTQRAQLFHFSAEGKKVPVPAHYERILFEREMYLLPHSSTNGAGRKMNEVYFWAGDEVPLSVVEDAQLFAQREARALGGKLVRLVQGKETSEFIQALGGIIIVRRGSSNKYDSLASNMLCGRRYMGQIAFDEVDFAPSSLCSGFPYLINQQGKCYLWKGKGSDVEELGCARLVGMDLALMGELLEVEEGKEPTNFWDIFNGGSRAQSADHWRLKPNYDRYCGRLFCSDTASKHQVCFTFPLSLRTATDLDRSLRLHPSSRPTCYLRTSMSSTPSSSCISLWALARRTSMLRSIMRSTSRRSTPSWQRGWKTDRLCQSRLLFSRASPVT